jgi:hypothetical protein
MTDETIDFGFRILPDRYTVRYYSEPEIDAEGSAGWLYRTQRMVPGWYAFTRSGCLGDYRGPFDAEAGAIEAGELWLTERAGS